MKLFLKNIFLFSAIAFILMHCFLLIDGLFLPRILGGNLFKYDNSFDFSSTRLQEAENKGKVDLLILGSSHAYRGYDTRSFEKLGLSAFNLGTSAQTLIQTEYLLNKYVDKLNPKIVILDVYPVITNSTGIESTLELLVLNPIDDDLTKMSLKTKDFRVFMTFYYRVIVDKFFGFSYPNDVKREAYEYIPNGYIESDVAGYVSESFRNGYVKISDDQLNALNHIYSILESRDIKFFIAQAPLPKERYTTLVGRDSLDQVFSSYAPYFNFNEYKFLPDSCFIDYDHINSNGVKVYNDWIIEQLSPYILD